MVERLVPEGFAEVRSKNSPEEALLRWRSLCAVVKNPARRFRFSADVPKRLEAQAMKKTFQGLLAVSMSRRRHGRNYTFNDQMPTKWD